MAQEKVDDVNSEDTTDIKFNILLGCTGSVASVKLPLIVQKLTNSPNSINRGSKRISVTYNVKVIATERSLHFFSLSEVERQVPVLLDQLEWDSWKEMNDPVMHIELRRWADLLVIAPLDANTLAKIACGMCDNLLTCVARAWDSDKPMLFCPAMNTHMWNHPVTEENLNKIKSFGYIEIPCVAKRLACGDTGLGAMAEVDTIVSVINRTVEKCLSNKVAEEC